MKLRRHYQAPISLWRRRICLQTNMSHFGTQIRQKILKVQYSDQILRLQRTLLSNKKGAGFFLKNEFRGPFSTLEPSIFVQGLRWLPTVHQLRLEAGRGVPRHSRSLPLCCQQDQKLKKPLSSRSGNIHSQTNSAERFERGLLERGFVGWRHNQIGWRGSHCAQGTSHGQVLSHFFYEVVDQIQHQFVKTPYGCFWSMGIFRTLGTSRT